MTVTVGIDGSRRIGRCTLAHIADSGPNDVQVIKLNATGPVETNANLLRYGSVHGRFSGKIAMNDNSIDLGRGPIEVMSTHDPRELKWSGCDVALERTDKFNDRKTSTVHIQQGAKAVFISAPIKNVEQTVIYGVNHRNLIPDDTIISNVSHTTNRLAPLAKVFGDACGIESGTITTIHSYTDDQPTIDRRHNDLYRAWAAAMAMIPNSKIAAKSLGETIPELSGKPDGTTMRVPSPNVSTVEFTFEASKTVTADDVNETMREASEEWLGQVLFFDSEP